MYYQMHYEERRLPVKNADSKFNSGGKIISISSNPLEDKGEKGMFQFEKFARLCKKDGEILDTSEPIAKVTKTQQTPIKNSPQTSQSKSYIKRGKIHKLDPNQNFSKNLKMEEPLSKIPDTESYKVTTKLLAPASIEVIQRFREYAVLKRLSAEHKKNDRIRVMIAQPKPLEDKLYTPVGKAAKKYAVEEWYKLKKWLLAVYSEDLKTINIHIMQKDQASKKFIEVKRD